MEVSDSPLLHINYAELKNALNEAEKIYQSPSMSTQVSKEAMLQHLSNAYRSFQEIKGRCQHIPSDLENEASRIFFLYGKCLYGGDMQASRRMFELSLTIQFIGLKTLNQAVVPPLLSDNLESLPKQFPTDTKTLDPLKDLLINTPRSVIVDTAKTQSKESAFHFAATMRWLGATYQNIDSFRGKENAPLFDKVYGVASDVWKEIALQGDDQWKKDCHWEVAQIIYNTERFRHYLKHPDDVKGALDTLKGVEPYLAAEGNSLRAQQLRAQIQNITAREIATLSPADPKEKLENLKLCYEAFSKAEQIAASTPEFDPFLRILFLNNKAAQALECLEQGCPVASIDEVRGWMNQVVETVEKEKYNHAYHAGFMANAARCEIYEQRWDNALSYLSKAESITDMYPDSSAETKKKIETTRLKLFQKLVKQGSLEDVERLISINPSYLDKQDDKGKTLLIHAIESHRPDNQPQCDRGIIIEALLNLNANANLADNSGWTPLYYAATQYRTDLLSKLIQKNGDANIANTDLSTPLHRLCDRGSLEGVNFLIASKVNVNAINCVGTPLFYAASKGHLAIIKALCEEGEADINLFGDPLEGTPLKQALLNNRHEVVEYLKSRGATTETKVDFIPLPEQQVDKFGRSAIFYDAAFGSMEALEKAERIDERDAKGRTPLDYAVREGQREAVNSLLSRGADLMARDSQGYFPLFWACQYHQVDIARDLIEHAKKNGTIKDMLSMRDNFGWSLLRKAAERGNLAMVELILDAMTEADVVLPAEEMQEAIIKARDHNHTDIYERLKAKG